MKNLLSPLREFKALSHLSGQEEGNLPRLETSLFLPKLGHSVEGGLSQGGFRGIWSL